MGAKAGVRAIRQAWKAAELDIELPSYAEDHRELAAALKKWG
jgi:ribulose-bisphosphate carboxylase large chain